MITSGGGLTTGSGGAPHACPKTNTPTTPNTRDRIIGAVYGSSPFGEALARVRDRTAETRSAYGRTASNSSDLCSRFGLRRSSPRRNIRAGSCTQRRPWCRAAGGTCHCRSRASRPSSARRTRRTRRDRCPSARTGSGSKRRAWCTSRCTPPRRHRQESHPAACWRPRLPAASRSCHTRSMTKQSTAKTRRACLWNLSRWRRISPLHGRQAVGVQVPLRALVVRHEVVRVAQAPARVAVRRLLRHAQRVEVHR